MIVQQDRQHNLNASRASLPAGHVRLVKSFQFEAAHLLPEMPKGHKCRRLHGHSFTVELECEGRPDPTSGILVDYGEMKRVFQPCHEMLDHRYLNEVEGLGNPTSEQIAIWIWNRVKPHLPSLSQVTVQETCSARCEYRG